QGNQRNARLLSGAPPLPTGPAYLLQALTHASHALAEQTSIRLQLGLTRPAQSDTALLAFQVGPAPGGTRGELSQLCQLHLELALVGASATRRSIRNQAGATEHSARKLLLRVAFLGWAEVVVSDHQLTGFRANDFGDFPRLARPHEISGIRAVSPPTDGGCNHSAGRNDQLTKLELCPSVILPWEIQVNQDS